MAADSEQLDHDGRGSQAYELFILVLTVLSLVVMVVMLLPISDAVVDVLQFYDNLICVVFLIDFALRLRRARPSSAYFIGGRGWLDLLGSIPSFGLAFRYTGLFRLARLSRLTRILRVVREKDRADLARDVLRNRGKYALFVTVLATLVVLSTASVMVLQFESRSAEANIDTGWNAFWYSVVTLTTVGYGDYYPVTVAGRIAAMTIMVAGVGLIGALASILASVLVGGDDDEPDDGASTEPGGAAGTDLAAQLAEIRAELAAVRALLETSSSGAGTPPP